MPHTFYRVVRTMPPTLDDFLSNEAKGIPMARPDPEVALLWDGISAYRTETQARNQAKTKPWLGNHISELTFSESDPITVRRTGTGRGHHTLWGEPAVLKGCVVRTVDV